MGTDLKNSKFKRLGHVLDVYVLKIVFLRRLSTVPYSVKEIFFLKERVKV